MSVCRACGTGRAARTRAASTADYGLLQEIYPKRYAK
jgi:hypothetical protein